MEFQNFKNGFSKEHLIEPRYSSGTHVIDRTFNGSEYYVRRVEISFFNLGSISAYFNGHARETIQLSKSVTDHHDSVAVI